MNLFGFLGSKAPVRKWGRVQNPTPTHTAGSVATERRTQTWQQRPAQIGTRPVQVLRPIDLGAGLTRAAVFGPRPTPFDEIGALEYGPAPQRIPKRFVKANDGYSGPNTVGSATVGKLCPDGDNAYVFAHLTPVPRSRGTTSVAPRGAVAQRRYVMDDSSGMPSSFIPVRVR